MTLSNTTVRHFSRTAFLASLLTAFLMSPLAGHLAHSQDRSQVTAAPVTLNDIYAQVGVLAPGFGGMFVDEDKDTLYVYMTSSGPDTPAQVANAVAAVFGDNRPRQSRLELLQGQYTFIQLKQWHDRMTMQVLALPGAVLTGIDQRNNRVEIGVETLDLSSQITQLMDQLQIPHGAVSIQQMPRAEAEDAPDEAAKVQLAQQADSQDEPLAGAGTCSAPCTLQSRIRPLVAGIKIQRDKAAPSQWCTISFIGFNGAFGFVTDSHCTNTQGGVDAPPAVMYQPMKPANADIVGTESQDPCYWDMNGVSQPPGCTPAPKKPTPACPKDRICRYSDSAFVGLAADVTKERGFIARPDGENKSADKCGNPGKAACNLNWTNGNYFQIGGENKMLVTGQSITKVGATTGWTQGTVNQVCMNQDYTSKGGAITVICGNDSSYWSRAGDSGSPVFQCLDAKSKVIPCNALANPNPVNMVGSHVAGGGTFNSIGPTNNGNTGGIQEPVYELGLIALCIPGRGC